MFDLDPTSWAALVAQLVRASAECHGFESHLRQLIFLLHLPQVAVCLSISSVVMYVSRLYDIKSI